MGFLKFVLAVVLVIGGIILMASAFLGGMQIGIADAMFGGDTSQVFTWIIGIVGFIVLLGGIYMLRRR